MPTPNVRFHRPAQPDPVLEQALLLYRTTQNALLATVHEVRVKDGHPTILAGKPLTLAAHRAIARALANDSSGWGYLPENVLMRHADHLIWYEPPQRRHLGFKLRADGEDVQEEHFGGLVHVPGTVFHLTANSWRVFAYATAGRPQPDTRLFHAPTLNTDVAGNICTGNVPTPQGSTADQISAWSAAFWNSNFTHPNFKGVVKYPGDVTQLWRDAVAGKHKTFPKKVLKPHRFNLGAYIDSLRSK